MRSFTQLALASVTSLDFGKKQLSPFKCHLSGRFSELDSLIQGWFVWIALPFSYPIVSLPLQKLTEQFQDSTTNFLSSLAISQGDLYRFQISSQIAPQLSFSHVFVWKAKCDFKYFPKTDSTSEVDTTTNWLYSRAESRWRAVYWTMDRCLGDFLRIICHFAINFSDFTSEYSNFNTRILFFVERNLNHWSPKRFWGENLLTTIPNPLSIFKYRDWCIRLSMMKLERQFQFLVLNSPPCSKGTVLSCRKNRLHNRF